MKPADFDYAAPATLDEALGLLAGDPEAKVLAGGQSLIPLLSLRLASPSLLIDLRRITGLDSIELTGSRLRIGAMVRQRRAEHDPTVRSAAPLLAEGLRHIAHPQIRSQGTIVGSIVHADPAAEMPATMLALDATIHARGAGGERAIAARDFFTGFLSNGLEYDEIVSAVEFDVASPRTGAACVEIAQRAGDYALCGAVAEVVVGAGEDVSRARIALFGISDRPLRAAGAEAALTGQPATAASAAEAAARAAEGIEPIEDPQVPAAYRTHLARVVTRRAIEQALERATA